jgi:hypothetical protein
VAEKAAIFQRIQLAKETTLGTAVTATKRLGSISVAPNPQVAINVPDIEGAKFPYTAQLGREWSEFRIGGNPVYDELHYLFNSVFGDVTPTTPGTPGGALARVWDYGVTTAAADTPATYTLEQGAIGGTDGMRYAGAAVTEVGLAITREGIELSGSGLAQAMTSPFTPTTAGVTELPQIPITPNSVDVFWDTTSAGLGTTKLLRLFRVELRLASRWSGIWPINSANASWEKLVEGRPEMSATIRVVTDTQGMSFYNTYMKQGTTGFLRVQALGGFIDTGSLNPYTLRWDQAAKVSGVGGFQIDQDLHMIEYTLGAVHDAGWTKSNAVRVTNKQATL